MINVMPPPCTAVQCRAKVLISKSSDEILLLVQATIRYVFLAYFDPKKQSFTIFSQLINFVQKC